MKVWTWTEAANEVRYIQSVNPQHPGPAFNYDPACFDRYREMQEKHARASGHGEQADQMQRNGWPAWRKPRV